MVRGGEIVIVGVCAAGKSTLAERLRGTGLRARTIAQEHSCIPGLWRQAGAAVTVYLHASFPAVTERRTSLMNQHMYDAQLARLAQARAGASVQVDTTHLTADQVYTRVLAEIAVVAREIPIADEPGSDVQPHPPVPLPATGEPGAEEQTTRLEDLPIPEEL